MSEKITKEDLQKIVSQAVTVNTKMIVKRTVQEMFNYYGAEQQKQSTEAVGILAKEISANMTKEIHEIWKKRDKADLVKKKEEKDNRLFNTRLLVMHYRKLKAHCDEIPEEIEELGDIVFDANQLSLDVLMQEKARTYKIMQYVDATLIAYAVLAKKQGDNVERRYKVLDRLYINENSLRASDLEELFNISSRQVYNDRDQAIKDLSVLLFGMSVIDFA